MKILLALCLLLAAGSAGAQQTVQVLNTNYRLGDTKFLTVDGRPFANATETFTEGTPYYKDEWMKGLLVSVDSQLYKDISIKLDLVENRLHYLNSEGKDFVSTTPLREIFLVQTGGDTLHFIHSSYLTGYSSLLPAGWYQQLASGRASLYMFFKKKVEENRPYGSAAPERSIRTENIFAVRTPAGLTEVKRIRDLPDVLNDKRTELQAFLKNTDDRKAAPEQRFTAAINYYNSLNP